MTYTRSLLLWSVVLLVAGSALAGWGPFVLAWFAGVGNDALPAASLEAFADPQAALTWAGFATIRILGALFVGLAFVLLAGRKLESLEARRLLAQGLAVISGLLLLMTAMQAQAILGPPAWIAVAILAVMFLDSLALVRRTGWAT